MPPRQLEAAAAERDHQLIVFRPRELAVDPHRDGVEDIGRLAYLAAQQRNENGLAERAAVLSRCAAVSSCKAP